MAEIDQILINLSTKVGEQSGKIEAIEHSVASMHTKMDNFGKIVTDSIRDSLINCKEIHHRPLLTSFNTIRESVNETKEEIKKHREIEHEKDYNYMNWLCLVKYHSWSIITTLLAVIAMIVLPSAYTTEPIEKLINLLISLKKIFI